MSMSSSSPAAPSAPFLAPEGVDRYVTFKGIDCMGLASAVVNKVLHWIVAEPAQCNELWERFRNRVEAARQPQPPLGTPDELFLVCSHTYYLYDLFEDCGDDEGEQFVRLIEDNCC